MKRILRVLLAITLIASTLLMIAGPAQAAAGEVLILGTTITGGMSSPEALAVIAAGKVPVVVTEAQWSAMTAADFASYDGIVLGDATCTTDKSVYAAAAANANIWGPVINGNIIIIGCDPVYHRGTEPGAQKLIDQGIAFSLAEPGKIGAYLCLSCYYHWDVSGTPVPFLDGIEGGSFTVIGGSFTSLNNVHITATHPALDGITDADLSNWDNSVHEAFVTFPIGLEVLAMAVDAGGNYTAPDGTVGYPYILARGVTVISDITLSPEADTNPLNTQHTVTATVTTDDPAIGTPVIGTTVTFRVIAGPHAGTTGTADTDNFGEASFTYTGTIVGEDTIEATFTDVAGRTQRSNRVTKEWTDETIPPTTTPPGPEVGGDIYPTNTMAQLTPLIVLAIILAAGTVVLVVHRRTQS